jgi:hypothetical protein
MRTKVTLFDFNRLIGEGGLTYIKASQIAWLDAHYWYFCPELCLIKHFLYEKTNLSKLNMK